MSQKLTPPQNPKKAFREAVRDYIRKYKVSRAEATFIMQEAERKLKNQLSEKPRDHQD